MHVHYHQKESLTVNEGRIGYQTLGGAEQFAGVGETVSFEAGMAHRFWNAGDTPLRCSGSISPPDNIVYFLTAIYASTKENGGTRPKAIDAAYLTRRYRSEFGMSDIPGFVQKVIFPIQVAIGKMTGQLKKYADAPDPVRR